MPHALCASVVFWIAGKSLKILFHQKLRDHLTDLVSGIDLVIAFFIAGCIGFGVGYYVLKGCGGDSDGGGPQKLDKVLSYMSDSPDGGIDNGKNQKEAQSTV